MEHQKPIHLTLDFLNGIGVAANNDYAFINREMGVVSSMCGMNNRFFRTGQPYRAKEIRIFHVKQGKARTSVNLIEHTLGEHSFGIIPPDSLLEFLEFDDEFDFQVLAVDSNFIPTPQHVVLTDQYTRQAFCMSDNLEEWQRTGTYFSLIWDAVHLHPYRREAVRHLVTSLFYHFHYLQADKHRDEQLRPSRQEELFRRFITLVNEHCKTQRTTAFYADRLCLSPRYLSSVIRNVSTAEAQRPAHLSDSRRVALPQPFVLQQVLQTDDGYDAAGVSADVKNAGLLPDPFNPEATSCCRPASSCPQ